MIKPVRCLFSINCDKNRFIPTKMIVNFTVEINDYTKGHMFTKNLKSRISIPIFMLFLILFSVAINAQAPAGYYDSAAGKIGIELKAALHNIIKGHTEKSYGDARYILDKTDQDLDNNNNVRVIYSNHSVSGTWDSGVTWNREHVWAKSRGIGDVDNYTKGAGSDLHNLRACISSINTARNNRWFAECDEPYQYNGENTGSYTSSSQWVWKPRDEDKGDVARMIFYMAARYEGDSDEPDLEVVNYFPDKYSNEPFHAKLSALYQWHLYDPVDDWECNRNEVIYSYQHNRNPFIDRPEFVARIWGDTTESDTPVIFFSEYIEGSDDNKALEIVNASDKSVDLSDHAILSNYNNSPWYTTRYVFPDETVLSPGDVWVIVHSGADSTIRNVADDSTGASVVNFNGDDVRALVKIMEGDTTFLDVIGLYNDPDLSYGWDVAGISKATQKHTLVRKPNVRQGNTNWTSSAGTNTDDSEWIVYDSDTFDYLGSHTITPSSLFGLCSAPDRLDSYRLYPCYPNPFNPTTTIQYDLFKETTVTLSIYDLRGIVVNTLVKERQEPGTYRVLWSGTNTNNSVVAAGVYLYQLQTIDGFMKTGKMILLK